MGQRPPNRVLVVEDNEWNLKLVQALLGRDHDVATAGTGREAIALAASFKPALILLDLRLPDIDGLTLARQLKSAAETRNIPIVALTAHTAADVAEAVRGAGCDELLSKPFDTAAFRDTVRRYLAGDAG